MTRDVVQGSQPHGVVDDAAFPVKIGGVATSARPSAVDSGDRVNADFDTFGAMATTDGGPRFTSSYTHTASADMSTTANITGAPSSGEYLVIDDIFFSTDTEMNFTFEEETSGTDIIKVYIGANGYLQYTPRGKIKLPTADKKLNGKASAAGNVAVTVCYHSEA